MKSCIWKTTFREIIQRKGQYVAIILIVALGVGMFAGLKNTGPAMRTMEQDYLDEHKFHDLMILSSLGLTEEDVEFFAGQEDVQAAEGVCFADGIFELPDGEEKVLKAYNMTTDVDEPVLMAGRMPKEADECLVDSKIFSEEVIGSMLLLVDDGREEMDSEDENDGDNGEEEESPFAFEEYTIVGLAQSPKYIQAERGNTSLGGGKLDGFFYLMREGFTSEVFMEVDVRFEGQWKLYSKEYDDFIEGKKDEWKELADLRANERKEKLTQEEIDKAYEENLADAEREAVDQAMEEVDKEIAEAEEKLKEEIKKEIEKKLKQFAMQGILLTPKDLGFDENADVHITYEDAGIDIEEIKEEAKETAREELLEEVTKEVKEEMPEAETYLLYRDSNVGYVTFENDSDIVDSIANVFPVFFFLVAALICMTTIGRMVEEQRTQIGVMKAIGYSGGRIMFKYIVYSGSAAVIGSVAGYFAGNFVFPRVIWYAYGMYYRMAQVPYLLNYLLLGISVLVSLLSTVGVTVLTCMHELSETAAGLMRPKAPKPGKRIFLEYIPFIWNWLKFLQKVSARNLFRYKKRFFMMVLGIGGCTALLVTGFGIKDSIGDVANEHFDEIQLYDLRVVYKDCVTEEKMDEIKEEYGQQIASMAAVYQESADAENASGGERFGLNFVIPREPEVFSDYFDLHDGDGQAIPFPRAGEVVLSESAAKHIGVKEGDFVILWEDDVTRTQARVSGICKNYLDNFAFFHEDTYRELSGKAPEYTSLFVNIKEGEDHHLLSAEWMKEEDVSVITLNLDIRERFETMMESLNIVVFAVIICAALLAFVVLYNLTSIQITERVREIATIKVLGFHEFETSSYVLRENIVLTIFGSILGLGLGKLLHAFVMSQIDIRIVCFDTRITWFGYLASVVLTILFALSVNLIMKTNIRKVSMTESLKCVE